MSEKYTGEFWYALSVDKYGLWQLFFYTFSAQPANQVKLDMSSAVAEMSDRLTTIDMGRKLGGCASFFGAGRELSPHLTQCGLGRGLPPYQVES